MKVVIQQKIKNHPEVIKKYGKTEKSINYKSM